MGNAVAAESVGPRGPCSCIASCFSGVRTAEARANTEPRPGRQLTTRRRAPSAPGGSCGVRKMRAPFEAT